MNASISTLVLLLLHLLVCLVLWLLIRCGILDIKGYFFPVILLVPIWGPLCVLILHTNRALFGDDLLEKTLEKMHINEEIHRSILVPGNADEEQVIPLEEALLVNNPLQKRQLILSVLTEAPTSYYHLLQQARLNNDSEVVHYASTALAQISKEADLTLQQHEQQYASDPDDPDILCSYCDYLESYIESGYVQGRAAEIQQRQLERLLNMIPPARPLTHFPNAGRREKSLGCSSCEWPPYCTMALRSRTFCTKSRSRMSILPPKDRKS